MRDIQPCQRCGENCRREHFAQQPTPDGRLITYLYCDSCNVGWESLWEPGGVGLELSFSLRYSSAEPNKLAVFLRNLEEANCVAA